jgi:putative hydrolase of the HAD superfamily
MCEVAIEAVLFDFGGVILTSPFDAFTTHEREHGLPEGFLRRLNATNPDDNAWARLERSEVDIEGFCALFESEAAAAGHPVDGHAVLALLSGELRPEMVTAIRRIRERGLRLALLTNNFVSADAPPARPELAEVMALFDVVVESSRVGVRKPAPRFYALALDELGVEAERAVFLDDLGVNLKPARALGMRTIKVVDPGQALAELEGVLGFPLRG